MAKDSFIPTKMLGTARTKPHRGPATPISKRARLSVMVPLILITAPKVPKGDRGKGMK